MWKWLNWNKNCEIGGIEIESWKFVESKFELCKLVEVKWKCENGWSKMKMCKFVELK